MSEANNSVLMHRKVTLSIKEVTNRKEFEEHISKTFIF